MISIQLLSLALVTQPSCADGRIDGFVFEQSTNRPIPALQVKVGGESRNTDSRGSFSVTLPCGNYPMFISGTDFVTVKTSSVAVIPGEVSEAFVTVTSTGSKPLLQVESAGPIFQVAKDESNAPRGTITGAIFDTDKKKPISGARIFARGRAEEVLSDDQGKFSLSLPAGDYDLTFIHSRFSTFTLRGLKVEGEKEIRTDVEMSPAALQLQALTVSAPRVEGSMTSVLSERRESGAVSDIIGADQMSKSGDSDAAGALKRVTGVTVIGGKFVYVRGLGERYSSTLLNGSSLPSPDPERRVVPLDMFPTDVLESVLIDKTFRPDLVGEFGGGSVQLRTRGFPKGFLANFSISGGITQGITFDTGPASVSGPTDFLGIDGSFRNLPPSVAEASRNEPLIQTDRFSTRGYTAEELEQFGEELAERYELLEQSIPPGLGLSGSIGDSFSLFGGKGGYFSSLAYDNGYGQDDSTVTIYTVGSGDLEQAHRYVFDEITNTISLSGIFTTGLDWESGDQIRLTTLLNRITDDEARVYEGPNRDLGENIRVTRFRWIERMMISQQVRGEHPLQFLNSTLGWRYTFAIATRDEPDRRSIRYDYEPSVQQWYLSDRPEGNRQVVSDLTNVNHDVAADWTIPFSFLKKEDSNIKSGFNVIFKNREVDTRRYKFQDRGPRSILPEVLSLPPEQIFVPENIGRDGFQLEEVTLVTDNYRAGQRVFSGYVMTDMALLESLRFVGGLRLELPRQTVETFEPFNPDATPVSAELTNVDVLPAGVFSLNLADDMVLRVGGSGTVSRPDFRELSPATFTDVTGGRLLFGNPDLQRTQIYHSDVRWEWYLSDTEMFSVAGFYKNFIDPIEIVVVPSAQLSLTYENAESASNFGLEIDFRKNFSFISSALEDLSISGNVAFIESQVRLREGSTIQTSKERPLQGQSPYVANVQLAYDNVDLGATGTIVYNVFGPRIAEVGALGAPDVYEEPVHLLDLVFSQNLGSGWKLKLKGSNLLDLPIRMTQGTNSVTNEPNLTRVRTRGRRVSLGLSKYL